MSEARRPGEVQRLAAAHALSSCPYESLASKKRMHTMSLEASPDASFRLF